MKVQDDSFFENLAETLQQFTAPETHHDSARQPSSHGKDRQQRSGKGNFDISEPIYLNTDKHKVKLVLEFQMPNTSTAKLASSSTLGKKDTDTHPKKIV